MKSKLKPLPVRPKFPIEDRLAELRKREREIIDAIVAAEAANAPYGDDEHTQSIEAEAYRLLTSDAALMPKAPKSTKPGLKALMRERDVVQFAMKMGSDMLTDLRAAWASQELSTRSDDWKQLVKDKALLIARLQQKEKEGQEFLAKFCLANSLLPCARFALGTAIGMQNTGPVHAFLTAALAAGIVTKSELSNVD